MIPLVLWSFLFFLSSFLHPSCNGPTIWRRLPTFRPALSTQLVPESSLITPCASSSLFPPNPQAQAQTQDPKLANLTLVGRDEPRVSQTPPAVAGRKERPAETPKLTSCDNPAPTVGTLKNFKRTKDSGRRKRRGKKERRIQNETTTELQSRTNGCFSNSSTNERTNGAPPPKLPRSAPSPSPTPTADRRHANLRTDPTQRTLICWRPT